MDHFVDGAKVYFYRPPSVLDVEKKTKKAKHIEHYVGPATIIKRIGSRSFQISYLNPLTGLTQLLQRDAGMIILKKEWNAPPSLIPMISRLEPARHQKWLPWRVLASTGQVLCSTHFFAGTIGTVCSTHGYYRVL